MCPTFGALALDPARVASRPTQSRPTNRRVKIDVIPFPGAWTPTESPKKQEVPNPSDAIARSATDMSEGVESRIRGSRKISDIFSTAYEDTASPLAETAQGLGELTGFWIAWGATDFTHGPADGNIDFGNIDDEPFIVHTENPTTKEISTDYYLRDGLHSITELIGKDGTITGELAYNSFGKIVRSSGKALEQCYSYTGREFDREIDLVFFRSRYYSPETGRFLSEDPRIDKAIIRNENSLYLYTSGNPINAIDPSGEFSLGEFMTASTISGLVGSLANAMIWRKKIGTVPALKSGFLIGFVGGGVGYTLGTLVAAGGSVFSQGLVSFSQNATQYVVNTLEANGIPASSEETRNLIFDTFKQALAQSVFAGIRGVAAADVAFKARITDGLGAVFLTKGLDGGMRLIQGMVEAMFN